MSSEAGCKICGDYEPSEHPDMCINCCIATLDHSEGLHEVGAWGVEGAVSTGGWDCPMCEADTTNGPILDLSYAEFLARYRGTGNAAAEITYEQ